ncbi:hypothetical protein GCM10027404_19480 [Arthrobacter tumbae]|uniref:hypothetical protein n=1 Tax=Arthrobacter tumbae TaxID=163874 RepID=UPI00195D5F0D|nr:hypothetical protein [Arthrobacter tumbae]MBM7780994.1 hypothetical protein [Arthrobacter tumbae]
MAERGNTTHGSIQDDQLKHEAQGLIQGGRVTRAEEWRESETIDDGGSTGDTGDTGDQPVYEPAAEPGQTGDMADDGPLTETIEDEVSDDNEEAQ